MKGGGEAGKASAVKILGEYFFLMRVFVHYEEVWPKKGYAEKIRSNIKMSIKNQFHIDIRQSSVSRRS